MTSKQYYFPYFFNLSELNKGLGKFNLEGKVLFNRKSELEEKLIISNKNKDLVHIPFGSSLMIVDFEIIIWETTEDSINITKINLVNFEIKTSKIDISNMILGKNEFKLDLNLKNFVSFLRKSDLKYNQQYYENYVIIIINKSEIKLIPFDYFNKKGGDYGYVWPAIARIDSEKNMLYGSGIRMNDFEIELNI